MSEHNNDQNSWDPNLAEYVFCINNSIRPSMQYNANYITYGIQPRDIVDRKRAKRTCSQSTRLKGQ